TVTDGLRVVDGTGSAEPETSAGRVNPCYITGEDGGTSGEACSVFEFVDNTPSSLRSLRGTAGTPGYFLYQNRARIDIPRPFVEIYNNGVEISTDGGATWSQGGFELPIPNLGAAEDVLPAGISGRIDFRIRAVDAPVDDGVEIVNDYVLGHQTYAPYNYAGLRLNPAIKEFERLFGEGSDATRAVSDIYLDALEVEGQDLEYYTPDEYGFEFIPSYPMRCEMLVTSGGKRVGNPCRDFRPQAHAAAQRLRTTSQHDYLMGVHDIIAEARAADYDGPFTRAFGEGLLRNLALGTAEGAPISGVVTLDGDPMPLAPVLARSELDDDGIQDFAAGFGWLDGRYNIWDVPTDTPLDVWVDGMIPDPATTLTVVDGASETADLDVSVGNTISGVVSIDGVPSADVIVSTPLASGFERRVLSDDDGAYQLTGLKTAEHDVTFEHPRISTTDRVVEVGAGDNVLDVEIASLGSVTGTVSAVGGGVLEGASVRIVPAAVPDGLDADEQSGIEVATSAADGSYVLDGLDPGDYLVFASADGYVEGFAPVTVASATETVDLALDPAATLTGVVADAGGVPASGAAVFAETVDQEDMLGETLTEDDGTFRIEGVPAGDVVVTALGSRGSDVATTSLVAEASIIHEVDLSFPAIGDVSVSVVNGVGDPVAGVRAEIVGGASGDQFLGTDYTGIDGQVVIEDVPVDGSTVVIGGVVSQTVPADHDGTVPIEIVIDSARVGGRLLDAGDEPIDDVEVLLLRDGESVARTLTSETGDFDFHVTAAGGYEIVADPASGLRRLAVAVTPGTDVDLGAIAPGPHSIGMTLDLDDGDEVEVLEYHEVEIPLPGVDDPRLVLRRFLSEDDPAVFEGLSSGLYQVVARNAARFIDEAVEVDGPESVLVGDTDTGRVLGTLIGSDGEPVTARIDALASGVAPVVDFSADDGTYSTGLAPGTYALLIRAEETGEAIRVDGVVVEAGVDVVVDAQTSAVASAIDVSLDSIGVLAANAHVSVRDVDTGVHFDALRGNARFDALPPGAYQVEVRVDGHLPWVEPVTVGAEDVEIVGSVGTPVALAPGYDPVVEVEEAGVGAARTVVDDGAVDALAEPPSRIDGPVAAMGINDVVTAEDVEFAVDFVQTGAGTAIETVKQKLTLVEPQRDPREAELRERLEHLKRKLDVRRTKDIGVCRSTISSQKAAIKWDERKEQFFQAWVDRHGDLDEVIRDVKFRTALTLLSAAIAAISIFVAIVLLAPLVIEGGIIATALGTLNAALGTTVIGSFTLAQFSALLSFILGLGPALVEGVDGFLDEAQSADATSFFKSLLFVIRGMVENLFAVAFLPLSVFGFNPSPFEMSSGFLALGTALEGEGEKYNKAQNEIDRLIDQAKATDAELAALAEQKSQVQFELKNTEELFRRQYSSVRLTEYSRFQRDRLEETAKKRNALRAELDRLNEIPDTNPQAERIAHLRNNRSGFAVFGEFLGAAGGAVLDVVSYFQALENQLEALRALDEQLLNGSDRYDAAERAYKNAINNSTLEVTRSSQSLLKPDCIDPIDPDDWDDVVNGYYIRPKDPNEIAGPLGGGDEHALKATPATLDYVIFFENLGPGSENVPPGEEIAEVSAARVTIETELDEDVNPDTVQLGDVQIGEVVIDVPDGLSAYEGVHGPYDDPGGEEGQIMIEVEGSIVDGSIRWVLTALEPGTGFVVGDLRGLLPPEDGTDIGKGSVGYSVAPGSGAGNGTVVTAQASIVFDDNDAIETNTWSNVFDSDSPEAHVVNAPDAADLPLDLEWESSDPTSSVVSVDVYARIGDEFIRLKRVDDTGSTTITEADFTFGYEPTPVEVPEDFVLVAADAPVDFAVVAIDAAGNSEVAPPAEAEATIELGT
ncbi:MAG: carboxypeptidase regulatory-like domain-containing protein, partial [Acidimicrobiales bacterium]|nr:carboxypeptidase regulatory-like domain-containing protein [Acidimicrobiales bacterium]